MLQKLQIVFFTALFIAQNIFISSALAADETEELKTMKIFSTRSTSSLENTPSSITVITRKDFQKKQYRQVQDALREVPGLSVARTGTFGGATTVFMRGTSGQSTLVLMDGVQLNQNTTGSFDFADLDLQLDNVERIEIIRGPQSTLWGADAVGGVINIITRKGKGPPSHSLSFEGGTFMTFKTTLGSSGDLGDLDYSVKASQIVSDGFSSAEKRRGNTESDGYRNLSLSARAGVDFLDDGRVEFIGRYVNSVVDLDIGSDSIGRVADGPELSEREEFNVSLPIQKSITDWWDVKFLPSIYYRVATTLQASFSSRIFNRTYALNLQNNLSLGEYISVVFGGEYELQQASNISSAFSTDIENYAAYLQTNFNFRDRLILTGGFRFDQNQSFEDSTTYKAEAAYNFHETGTRIRWATATGFRAPSANDLAFPSFTFFGVTFLSGNPDLQPETSQSWEVGFDQSLFDEKIKLSFTYFDMEIENLIASDPQFVFPNPKTFQLQNIGFATSQGTETHLEADLPCNFILQFNHTWNRAIGQDRKQLTRRPRIKYSVNLQYVPSDKFDALVGFNFKQAVNTAVTTRTDDYTTVRIAMRYQLNKHLRISGRIENLLDEEYTEIGGGFDTSGIAGYAGFVFTFN